MLNLLEDSDNFCYKGTDIRKRSETEVYVDRTVVCSLLVLLVNMIV